MIYKITIQDKDKVQTDVTNYVDMGFSEHTKLSESLDTGSLIIQFTDREEVYGMFDVVNIQVDNVTSSYRVSGDSVELISKQPSRYKHTLSLIEPTKVLEREIVNGFKVTQPTDLSFTYTLYDVVERLRKTVPLEKNDLLNETRLFIVSSQAKTVLEQIVSPEFTWNNYTLRQCLDEVCSIVDGVARLDKNGNLTIDFFNETYDAISEIDDTFNDKRRSQDVEFYATNMEISAINLINDNENAQSVEIYPANGYTTIRSDEYYVDFLKSYIPTFKKFYDFSKLFFLENVTILLQSDFWLTPVIPSLSEASSTKLYNLDLSDRVVENDFFRTLDVYHDEQGTYTSESTLLADFPNGQTDPTDWQGYSAFVESTDTTWLWDVNTNQWVDSGLFAPLSQFSTLRFEKYKQNLIVNDTFGLFDTKTILDNVISASNAQNVVRSPNKVLESTGIEYWGFTLDWGTATNLVDPAYVGEFSTFSNLPASSTDNYYAFVTDTQSWYGWSDSNNQWELLPDASGSPTVSVTAEFSGIPTNEKDYLFQVHYVPVHNDLLVDVERDDVSDVYYKLSLLSNQQARIIDFDDLVNRGKGKINRIGNEDINFTHTVRNVSELFKVGDYTTDNFIISEVEKIYFNDYIVAKYALTKNFNRISKFVGINSEIRQWEIPTGANTQSRNFKYKDYCVVDAHNDSTSVGLNTGKALMDDGKNTILETIYDGTTFNPVRAGYMINPYNNDVLYLDVSSNASKANMLVFNYKTKDNIVVADRVITNGAVTIDGTTFIKQDAIEGVRYTDIYGRVNELNSYLITNLGGKTTIDEYILQGRNLPLIDPLQTPVNRQVVDLSDFPIEKDGGEHLKFTYQVDFFNRNNRVIIGEQFLKRNRLISENTFDNNGMMIYYYTDLVLKGKHKRKAPTPDFSEVVGGVRNDGVTQANWITIDKTNNRYLFTFQSLDSYKSWALVDVDGNTILGVNQEIGTAYYNITFDFTHFRENVYRITPSPFGDIDGVINVVSNFTFEHKPYKLVSKTLNGVVNLTSNFTYTVEKLNVGSGSFNGVVNTNLGFTYESSQPKVASGSFSGSIGTSLSLTYGVTKFDVASGSFSGSVSTSLGFTYDPCWQVCTFNVVDTYFSGTDDTTNEGATCGNNVEKTICTYDTDLKQWLCTDYIGVVTTECAV